MPNQPATARDPRIVIHPEYCKQIIDGRQCKKQDRYDGYCRRHAEARGLIKPHAAH